MMEIVLMTNFMAMIVKFLAIKEENIVINVIEMEIVLLVLIIIFGI